MTDKQALREVAECIDRKEWKVLDNGDDKYQVITSCEHCQCHHAIEVTSRSLSGRYLYAGDVVKCPGCGNQGVIDADADGAWVEWDMERKN
ncbi:hypothetical protein [Citrobacter braakii]|uniref:Uncharacterized protein n=1 Tax=Citrobacter braakii TaxID=57706 RepID=A0A1V8NR88_CITBR|nr:hypothetical protein [Citrobacter braakii]EBW7148979.1 hypothetical protein [Salmonella enterica subsp. enterica serovar Coeln]OQM38924.1 hypothetical protein BZK42_27610 [Citrobacter braakii]QXC16522.1 hypothetical protein I6L51_26650 [Citrobacter braakii]